MKRMQSIYSKGKWTLFKISDEIHQAYPIMILMSHLNETSRKFKLQITHKNI